MGKFRSKLKGQSKGKRWPKGQSSSSNPVTQKYRSLAKSSFFQENLGSKSGLTINALNKHDAIQSYASPKASYLGDLAESLHSVKIDDDNASQILSETETQSCGTFRTFQTFASDWSECSNVSFSKLLNGFKSDSILHKEMLAILAAITELLKERNGKQTSTEYYMALLEILNQDQEERSDHATLSLLSMGIKTVPESVIKLKFSETSKMFMDLLEKYCNSDNQSLLRCLLGCISVQLRALDLAHWSNSSTLQMFDAVMAFSIHSKPRLRKAAQHAVCTIIKGSSFMLKEDSPKLHPAAGTVSKFCLMQMKPELEASSQTTILHILALLKDIMYIFPKECIKITCERLLSMMTANNVLVRTCCLQTLHSLFLMSSDNSKIKNLTDDDIVELNKKKIPSTNLTSLLAAKLIKALYDYRPDRNDVRQTIAWITVMQQGYICLSCLDSDMSISIIPQFITTCTTDLWLSDQVDIANAGTIALREVLYESIAPVCNSFLGVQKHKTVLEKIFETISKALTVPFGHAADKVVNILSVCFDVAGRNCAEQLAEPLKMLGERRDPLSQTMVKSQFGQIDHAIATAVKTMGPEFVLKCIPITNESGEININRTWVLPILRDKIRGSTLEYFGSHILRLASACKRASEQFIQEDKENDSITYNLLCSQLWGLFPGFCNSPTDILESFKKIAKVLGDTLMQKPDLRTPILQGLRKLINSAEGDEINELARFSKNYLPLLLNIYTTSSNVCEQGQRLSALETIQIYLTITPSDKCEEIFKNLLSKIDEANNENDSFVKEALFDIARAMSVYQSEAMLKLLYAKLLPLCEPSADKGKKEKNKHTLQKKAFKIIEDILKSDKNGCKEFVNNNKNQIQSIVVKSLNTSAENSRATRLRSLELLVKSQPQLDCESKLVKTCIAEAVLSTRDINAKCRKCAQSLLVTVGEIVEAKKKKDGLSEYINVLIAGLAGTPQMIAATLQALACITYHFSGSLGKDTLDFLLAQVCALLALPTREITVAAVNFVIVFTKSLPTPQVALYLENIMKAIGSMTDDCKRHARMEIGKLLSRMSRKYTAETLTKLTPGDDLVTHKKLRNLRKQQSRTKRLKEAKQNDTFEENDELMDIKPTAKSIEEILADSDSDDMCNEDDIRKTKGQNNKKNKGKEKSLIRETEDSIIDLIDANAASKILSSKPESSKASKKTKSEPNRGFKTAEDGRLVIDDLDGDSSDGDEHRKKNKGFLSMNSDSESDEDDGAYEKPALGKRKRSDNQSTKSGFSSSSQPKTKYLAGGKGIHRSLSGTSVKSGASGKSYSTAKSSKSTNKFGSEYKATKAAGDIKKKGRPDPYAYIPLMRNSLNKRKRTKYAGQFRGIVKAAKKGATIGSKLRKSKKM